jgi:hypothetical protein
MSLDELLERYQHAADAFSRGDPGPRHEGGEWKIVHRHADPISTENDSGPMRTS